MAKTRSKYVVKSRFGQLFAWEIRLNASCEAEANGRGEIEQRVRVRFDMYSLVFVRLCRMEYDTTIQRAKRENFTALGEERHGTDGVCDRQGEQAAMLVKLR